MKYYRLLTALPELPDTPARPPASLSTIIPQLKEDLSEGDWLLAEAVLNWLDCQNLEAKIAGRDSFDERAPLQRESLDDRTEMPEFMGSFLEELDAGAISGSYPVDELWRRYHQYLVEVANQKGCGMLAEWATWDGGLRNALAQERSTQLGVELEGRLFEDCEEASSFSDVVAALTEATDPQEREKLVDEFRLTKLNELAGTNPFSKEAVLSFLLRAVVLDRWELSSEVDAKQLLEVIS